MTQSPNHLVSNPYVGPRTFTYAQRRFFFGREREARDLLARVVSERVLLFYAQSGAGKSSLLQTRLIPQLREEEGFAVLPVGRVSGALPTGLGEVANLYLFNLMASLDQGNRDPHRLARLSLSRFLAQLTSEDGEHWHYVETPAVAQTIAEAAIPTGGALPKGAAAAVIAPAAPPTTNGAVHPAEPEQRYALIIDQFEEIITTHPNRWREREEFFRQLNQALLDDRNLWVVLTLREDYVAALDPYAGFMADKLRARFYMERMGVAAALEAVRQPAALAGRPFAAGVAEALVDNLRRIKVTGQAEQLGQYVEPVQLQVVCYQLWEKVTAAGSPSAALPEAIPAAITMTDLQQSGDVNTALGDFYNGAVATVLKEVGPTLAERRLRTWVNTQLITEAGTRGTVYQGLADTAGLPNPIVKRLTDQFLLRAEQRAGGYWVELVHDRFVEPIQRSNRAWLHDHQHPLTRAAQSWRDAQKDGNLLLIGTQVQSAQAQLVGAPGEFGELEEEFVQASLAATQRQRQRRQRLFLGAALLMVLVLASLTTWALSNANYAQEQQNKANHERSTAVAALTVQSKIVQTSIARLEIAEGTRVQTVKLNSELAGNLAILLTAQAAQVAATVATPIATPQLIATPTAYSDASDTPTAPAVIPSPSPGVDLPATATAAAIVNSAATSDAIQQELVQVQATQTAAVESAATSTIAVGQVLQTTDWINVRRAPGYVGKPADDVIGQVAPETPVVIVAGPANVDSILWWQIQRVGTPSVAITGWVATAINGEALLAATSFSNLSLAKPFTGDYPITQYFGENPEFYSQFLYDGVPLKGNIKLDFGLPTDTPVLATDSGRVKRVDYESGGFGNFIILEHAWGESIYTQLNAAGVTAGQTVERGEQIGLSGSSGAANGPYLSFGIRLNPYSRSDGWGGFSDPLPYLHLVSE